MFVEYPYSWDMNNATQPAPLPRRTAPAPANTVTLCGDLARLILVDSDAQADVLRDRASTIDIVSYEVETARESREEVAGQLATLIQDSLWAASSERRAMLPVLERLLRDGYNAGSVVTVAVIDGRVGA